MKTLADMTEEERSNCPGMWAETSTGYTGIIVYENGKQAYLIIPEFNREQTFPLANVTPRYDLPRAWTPDGQPPAGEWAYANPHDMERMHVRMPDEDTTHRRWISKWEEL